MKNTVVSSAIIKNNSGEVLLLHYDKEKERGVLIPPGGKIELGETPRETAIRETKEELGIDIEIIKLIGVSELDYGDGKPWVFLFYSANIIDGRPKIMEDDRVDGKSLGFKYAKLSEMNHYKNITWL
jgi:8-oxo-dGTP diphosphatase